MVVREVDYDFAAATTPEEIKYLRKADGQNTKCCRSTVVRCTSAEKNKRSTGEIFVVYSRNAQASVIK